MQTSLNLMMPLVLPEISMTLWRCRLSNETAAWDDAAGGSVALVYLYAGDALML